MKKVLLALVGLVSLTAASCFAQNISASALSGFYVFQATGFDANDFASGTPNMVHTGEVAVLGVLQFDGMGHFTGTLNFTSADSGGASTNPDQAVCSESLTGTDGAFSVTPSNAAFGVDSGPALGTISISFDSTSKTSAGAINFNTLVANGGKTILLLESDASISNLTICGESISTMALKGALNRTFLGVDTLF